MKKFAALAAVSAFLVTPVMAEQLYSFADVSMNYLDWDSNAEGTGKSDFVFAELEGGAGYTWGELYGFFDIENLGDGDQSTSYFGKGMMDVKLGEAGWMFHTHLTSAWGGGWHDMSTFAGISYKYNGGNGFWIKPYLAARHTDTSGFTGMNGYQFGFAWGYPFTVGGQQFTLAQWHETDFGREESYTGNTMKSVGHNGAVSAWWNATDQLQLGVQYRYADEHLGAAVYQDGFITTVKYNF